MEEGELQRACKFEQEHELLKNNQFNAAQLARIVLLFSNLSVLLVSIYLFGLVNLAVYLTNWGLLSTIY